MRLERLRNAVGNVLSVRREPAEDAIRRFEQEQDERYKRLSPEMAEVHRLVDAQAITVEIPRKIEVTLFSRKKEFTRREQFHNGF